MRPVDAAVQVAVTGMGAVTGLGRSLQDTFARLLQAQSGVVRLTGAVGEHCVDALGVPVPAAFDATVPRAEVQLDRATQLGLNAARQALADAALSPDDHNSHRVGVCVGTGLGGLHTLEPLYERLFARLHGVQPGDAMSVHPLSVPRIMPSALASWLSIQHGFKGPAHTYSVACASSAVAIGEAYRSILHGYADAVLVVGAESFLTLGSYAAWTALRAMARPDAGNAAASCKPFDKDRSGFVLGEGAAALLLERAELARRRGATVQAEVVGYGSSSDATHITLPNAAGQAAAMRAALAEAQRHGVASDTIGHINAHGTATPAGDVAEAESIRLAFGAHAPRLLVSATKALHGHLIGAAGALEFALAIQALRTGSVPPTAHLHNPDPRCDLDCVPLHARHGQQLHAVMSNSFAFGGSNVALIARRAEL